MFGGLVQNAAARSLATDEPAGSQDGEVLGDRAGALRGIALLAALPVLVAEMRAR